MENICLQSKSHTSANTRRFLVQHPLCDRFHLTASNHTCYTLEKCARDIMRETSTDTLRSVESVTFIGGRCRFLNSNKVWKMSVWTIWSIEKWKYLQTSDSDIYEADLLLDIFYIKRLKDIFTHWICSFLISNLSDWQKCVSQNMLKSFIFASINIHLKDKGNNYQSLLCF